MSITTTGRTTATVRTPEDGGPPRLPFTPVGWGSSVLIAVVAACTLAIYVPEEPTTRAAFALGLMIALMLSRMPIGVAMLVPGMLGVHAIRGADAVAGLMANTTFHTAASWSMSVVPLFIFMGTLLWRAGITDDLFVAGDVWLRRLPGGLPVATNIAGAGMSAVTGSTIATTYTLARSGIPGMLRSGYSPRAAIASVMSAGLPGQLIPPSVLLVIYAGVAEVPVGPQLVAGVVPGLLITAFFAAAFVVIAALQRRKGGGPQVAQAAPARVRWSAAVHTWPILIIGLVVVGGIYGGFTTATEAAAAAAVVSVVLTYVRKPKEATGVIGRASVDALQSTGAIFLLILGAKAIALMLTVSRLGMEFTDAMVNLGLGRVTFLLLLLVAFLVLGMFMDTLALILVTVPLLIPVLAELDVSLIWFGVFVTLLGELAIIHPPVGILAYVILDACKAPDVNLGHRISLGDVFIASLYVIPGAVLVLLVLIFFPALGVVGA